MREPSHYTCEAGGLPWDCTVFQSNFRSINHGYFNEEHNLHTKRRAGKKQKKTLRQILVLTM